VAALAACDSNPSTAANSAAPVSVQTATAAERDVPIVLNATGSILADEVAEVAARVSGVVADTPLDIVASLAEGDVIVVLDDIEARLRLEQADAAVTEGQAGVESARAAAEAAQGHSDLTVENARAMAGLFDKGGISQNQNDQAQEQARAAIDAAEEARLQVVSSQASLKAAESRAMQARQDLENCRIRAPFAGFLSRRSPSRGEFVASGSTVAQVLRLDPVRIVVLIPEAEMPALEQNLVATAEVAAYPGTIFNGKVIAVSPAVDEISRTATAIIAFPNADSRLRPGMFATVAISQTATEKAVFVPTAAIITDAETATSRVFAVRDGTATLLVVQPGDASGDQTRILNGVEAGEVIATSNLAGLRDGAKVTTGS